ncbi:redoxin domain-containing protein [bacterium]|nr:redoxin domain-containing protein [bacterium]
MPLYKQTVHAPEIPSNLDWLNTDRKLSLSDLHGKVVLLDFWTYCCINCQHVLPKLAHLEEKYGDALVVVGVHSAKFQDEGASENIRQAILRHNIQHPVVNDRQFQVWKSYAVRAWPTMVLIDPDGYVVSTESGESAPDKFDPWIAGLIEHFDEQGMLDRTPLNLTKEKDLAPDNLLAFPSKIRVDEAGDRLFIADSNHDRIVVANRATGEVLQLIGSGESGLSDGSFSEARFNHPQGMELIGDVLYIADTQNHVLRAADLENESVTTVAGTGEQGGYGHGSGRALDTPLASPWDLVWDGERLYIAMAGPHQLWYYDPTDERVGVWAGTGQEDLIDAPLLDAALAQPSGVTYDGRNWIFFADSEVSAVRGAQTDDGGLVNTVIGHGLFEFGDIDGDRLKARLQHPLGVSYHDGLIYVADTYNNKIKVVDPGERTSQTWAGTGIGGLKDGPKAKARFDEPGGIDVAEDGTVYIADTNNHAIRVIDPDSGEVRTLALTGLTKMMPQKESIDTSNAMTLSKQTVSATTRTLDIDMTFPDGFKLNAAGGLQLMLEGASANQDDLFTTHLPASVPVTLEAGASELIVSFSFVYCRVDNEGLCYFGDQVARVPLVWAEDGSAPNTIPLTITVDHTE